MKGQGDRKPGFDRTIIGGFAIDFYSKKVCKFLMSHSPEEDRPN